MFLAPLATLNAADATAEKATLSNEERLEYTRNALIAHNHRILGGWQPPAVEGPTNRHYPAGRAPLVRSAYVKLPLGAVRPEGWLRRQLKLQADGITGHYYENFKIEKSAELFNYFEGFIPLAFLLDHEEFKARAKKYVYGEMRAQLQHPLTFTSHSGGESAYQSLRAMTEYYEVTGDPGVLKMISGFFAALKGELIADHREFKYWERWRAGEYTQVALWLYQRTGEKHLLETIERNWRWPVDNVWSFYLLTGPYWPMRSELEKIPDIPASKKGLLEKRPWSLHHCVNMAMQIKYPGLYYQLRPELVYGNATFYGLERLEHIYGLTAGRFTGHEHFEPGPHQGRHPSNGHELCAISELMTSMEKLYEVFGDGRLADRLELLLFNAYAGQITPDYWCHQYDGQSNQVAVRVAKHQFGNDATANIYGFVPGYRCCLNNMHAGWPKFVQNMWLATQDQGLVAAAYGPCEVTALVGDGAQVTIKEQTDYPFDGEITMTVTPERPVRFPLHLRIPAWASGARVEIGSERLEPAAGSICRIEREWNPGDTVRVHFPMRLRTETRYNNSVSILRGPVYYSLRVGMEPKRLPSWHASATKGIELGYPTYDWEIEATTPWNYGLLLDRANPERDIQVVRNPIGALPFAQKGEQVYLRRGERQYEKVVSTEDAPVVLKVKGRRLPQWGMGEIKMADKPRDSSSIWAKENRPLLDLLPDWKNTAADAASPPVSPVESTEPVEDLELIPFGSARLRVTELPTLSR
jgi:hypothetical protein